MKSEKYLLTTMGTGRARMKTPMRAQSPPMSWKFKDDFEVYESDFWGYEADFGVMKLIFGVMKLILGL